MDEWNWSKNTLLQIDPQKITAGTPIKVWWKCGQGHSWKAAVSTRNKMNSGCPVCYRKNQKQILTKYYLKKIGTFYDSNKTLMMEWDWEKNNALQIDPKNITTGFTKKVWWKCKEGHSWRTTIKSRAKNETNCKLCFDKDRSRIRRLTLIKTFGSIEKKHSKLLQLWSNKNNTEFGLLPYETPSTYKKKLYWHCETCNAEMFTTIDTISKYMQCPHPIHNKYWKH
jgi:hypothetical protein